MRDMYVKTKPKLQPLYNLQYRNLVVILGKIVKGILRISESAETQIRIRSI